MSAVKYGSDGIKMKVCNRVIGHNTYSGAAEKLRHLFADGINFNQRLGVFLFSPTLSPFFTKNGERDVKILKKSGIYFSTGKSAKLVPCLPAAVMTSRLSILIRPSLRSVSKQR